MGELARRILTASLLLPPVLAAIWFGGVWFLVLLAVVGVALTWEWSQLFGAPPPPPPLLASLHIAALIGVGVFLFDDFFFEPQSLIIIGLSCIGSLMIAWLTDRDKGLAFFGPIYLITPLVLIADLRADESLGALAVLVFLSLVWASDIGAYFFGRLIGGPRLFPKVSANKTWAGAFGGLLASMLAGSVAGIFIGVSEGVVLSLWGGVISIATQTGDFLESAIKRRYNLKDMGSLLPGHGGFLDRVDGLIVAIFVFYILVFAQGWPESSAAEIFLKYN